jgi:hypothetical protein
MTAAVAAVDAAVVAALVAAGGDAEALAEAVSRAEAAGLDSIPGEDRQKLRGELRGGRGQLAGVDIIQLFRGWNGWL